MAVNYWCSQTNAYLHKKRTHISHMGKSSLFGKTGIVAMTSREERKIEPLTVLLTPEGQQRLDLKRGLTHRLLITQSDQMCHTEHAP